MKRYAEWSAGKFLRDDGASFLKSADNKDYAEMIDLVAAGKAEIGDFTTQGVGPAWAWLKS